MNKTQIRLVATLFLLGMAGALTILNMDLPLPEEAKAQLLQRFSPTQLKLLMLINPAIMTLGSAFLGVLLYKKVNLSIPLLEGWIEPPVRVDWKKIAFHGLIGGAIAGGAISAVALVFMPYLPAEFVAFGKQFQPGLVPRLLYGGITEEILMRLGLMTLLVWLLFQITKNLRPAVYWAAIVISAFGFALGHLPLVFNVVSQPPPALFAYIILGNMAGGMVFGLLYWKRGLESAMLAHMTAHLVMMVIEAATGM